MLLDDEETIRTAERLREELSVASHPILADPLSAVVNTSIFGHERGRSYSSTAFQRVDSHMPQRLDSQLPKRLDSQLPKQGVHRTVLPGDLGSLETSVTRPGNS